MLWSTHSLVSRPCSARQALSFHGGALKVSWLSDANKGKQPTETIGEMEMIAFLIQIRRVMVRGIQGLRSLVRQAEHNRRPQR